MGKLCIIGVDDNKVLKDFVRTHVELLKGEKVCLDKYYPDYTHQGKRLLYHYGKHSLRRKCEQLLPTFLYYRWITKQERSPASARRALKAFFREHDVDVILVEFGNAGARIAPEARALGIPLVVHFHGHDAHHETVVAEYKERYRAMFDYASSIVSVSRFMTDALIALGADPAKIVYNPYGPRDAFFECRSDYRSTLLAVGRFTDIKAPYLTLMAFRLLTEECPEARLIMVGGDEGLLECCKTLTSVWGIESKVSFPGAIPHAQIRTLFAQACCFVQHSVITSYGNAEGTPVAIIEAGAAGLPVVSTRHAGIPDIVVHGQTGFLVEERDVLGMKNYMRKLIEDKPLCRAMGEAARQRIRAHFSLSRYCLPSRGD